MVYTPPISVHFCRPQDDACSLDDVDRALFILALLRRVVVPVPRKVYIDCECLGLSLRRRLKNKKSLSSPVQPASPTRPPLPASQEIKSDDITYAAFFYELLYKRQSQ